MRIVIIGGGPAGMSCALWLKVFGHECFILEREAKLGGLQRLNPHHNRWLLGAIGQRGTDVAGQFARHMEVEGVPSIVDCTVNRIVANGTGGFAVTGTRKGEGELSLTANAIVVATGTRPRTLPMIERLRAQTTRLVVGPTGLAIRDLIFGQRVAILGGGDNGIDHAVYLAERGNRVTVFLRSKPRARARFLALAARSPSIELRTYAQLEVLSASATEVAVGVDGEAIGFDYFLAMLGYDPNTEFLRETLVDVAITLGPAGYVTVDRDQRTAHPGVYAIGDVTNAQQPCVATALGQGAAAAKHIDQQASD